MAFALKIKSKGLFGRVKSINFNELISNCNLRYGSANDFQILREGQIEQNTAVLYNPNRIGRGIFIDMNKVSEGEITISHSIPTTRTEIQDFVKVAKEIERQFKKASFYCEDEKKEYSTSELENNIENMVEFNRKSLQQFMNNEQFPQLILTLAKYPWFLENEYREAYKACMNLDDFENRIHALQDNDYYYAKPSLMKNNNDNKVYAFYALTSNCASIFPTKANSFINMSNVKVDEGRVQFFIFEEKKMMDGIYSYDKFVEYLMNNGATKFDASHILIPGNVSKEEIIKIIESIKD